MIQTGKNGPDKDGPEMYWKGSRNDTDVHAYTNTVPYSNLDSP